MEIVNFLVAGKTPVLSSNNVTCCATGYPQPSVLINGQQSSNMAANFSRGIYTVCSSVSLTAPSDPGYANVNCTAEHYTCSCMPQKAYELCEKTTNMRMTCRRILVEGNVICFRLIILFTWSSVSHGLVTVMSVRGAVCPHKNRDFAIESIAEKELS